MTDRQLDVDEDGDSCLPVDVDLLRLMLPFEADESVVAAVLVVKVIGPDDDLSEPWIRTVKDPSMDWITAMGMIEAAKLQTSEGYRSRDEIEDES